MSEALLQAEHVDVFYGDFQALTDISLEIGSGEIVAVIGATAPARACCFKTIAG
ncbi:MAG: hypothetical protein R3D52_03310 [Xanthobacteraceae bacterium]